MEGGSRTARCVYRLSPRWLSVIAAAMRPLSDYPDGILSVELNRFAVEF